MLDENGQPAIPNFKPPNAPFNLKNLLQATQTFDNTSDHQASQKWSLGFLKNSFYSYNNLPLEVYSTLMTVLPAPSI